MPLLNSLKRNWDQVSRLGPAVLLRHVKPREPIATYQMKGVGTVHLRLDNSDLAAFAQVFEAREYDLARHGAAGARAQARYEAILREGKVPVIIDAGANVGAASLWFARAYPRARVIAIEPDPANYAVLSRNVAGQANIVPVQAAIAGESGFVAVDGGAMGWASTTRKAQSGTPAITMAQALALVESGAGFIGKVDIEGFEQDLFAGDTGWIDQMYVVMIEPHDWMLPGQRTSRSFQAAMGQRDFDLYISGENLFYVAV